MMKNKFLFQFHIFFFFRNLIEIIFKCEKYYLQKFLVSKIFYKIGMGAIWTALIRLEL